MKTISFKAPAEDYANWRKEALDEGYTFGAWARRKLNGGLALPPPLPVAPKLAAIAINETLMDQVVKAKTPCHHRLPPGTYCKTCERIKK